jgi:hypothetical protein
LIPTFTSIFYTQLLRCPPVSSSALSYVVPKPSRGSVYISCPSWGQCIHRPHRVLGVPQVGHSPI